MAAQTDLQHLEGVKEEYQYGFHDEEKAVFKSEKGLTHKVVDQIADIKNEPDWMRQFQARSVGDILFQADADLGRRSERHRL